MSDLIYATNRIFYLEETSIDDNDTQKESTLIPVAQYTKVNDHFVSIIEVEFFLLGKSYSNYDGEILSIFSFDKTCS